VPELRPYHEPGQRTRHEYQLTQKGLDFQPVIHALLQWGAQWESDTAGPPVRPVHRDCGAAIHTRLRCDDDHDVDPHDVQIEESPGLITLA
jgi:hypothetical protein